MNSILFATSATLIIIGVWFQYINVKVKSFYAAFASVGTFWVVWTACVLSVYTTENLSQSKTALLASAAPKGVLEIVDLTEVGTNRFAIIRMTDKDSFLQYGAVGNEVRLYDLAGVKNAGSSFTNRFFLFDSGINRLVPVLPNWRQP